MSSNVEPRCCIDLAGYELQALGLRDRILAAVRLEVADHDVDALRPQLLRLGQHLVSLADAGRVAQKYFEFAARAHQSHYQAAWRRGCGNIRTSIPSASLISRSTGLRAQTFHRALLRVADEDLRDALFAREADDLVRWDRAPSITWTSAPSLRANSRFSSTLLLGLARQVALLDINGQQLSRETGLWRGAPLASMSRALLRGVMQTRMRSCVPQLCTMPCASM